MLRLPPHKMPFLRGLGRLMIQNQNGEFAAVGKQAGVINKRYSIAPVTDANEHSKWLIRGEGLASGSSPILIFGLGAEGAASVKVEYLDGSLHESSGPLESGVATFVE